MESGKTGLNLLVFDFKNPQ